MTVRDYWITLCVSVPLALVAIAAIVWVGVTTGGDPAAIVSVAAWAVLVIGAALIAAYALRETRRHSVPIPHQRTPSR